MIPRQDKLKEFIITKPLFYEMLKGFISQKEKDHYEPRTIKWPKYTSIRNLI